MTYLLVRKAPHKPEIKKAIKNMSQKDQFAMLRLIAGISEMSYRRGLHHGVKLCKDGRHEQGFNHKSLERSTCKLYLDVPLSSGKEVFEDMKKKKWSLVDKSTVKSNLGRLSIKYGPHLYDLGFDPGVLKALSDEVI